MRSAATGASDGSSLTRNLRALTAARVLYGVVLLGFPRTLVSDLGGRREDRAVRVIARLLGVRHLVEAAVVERHHSRSWILADATVDGAHAGTMLAVAAVDRRRRRLALTNALVAGALTWADVRTARRI